MSASLREKAHELLTQQGASRSEFKGMVRFLVAKEQIVDVVLALREAGFELLSDIFGIDYSTYPGYQGKRFALTYNLYSISHNERIFVRVMLDDGEDVPSLTPRWRGASFMEREVYDMFGIIFSGHPDLRKLLTPEDLDGHPLRKDFPIGETPTLFNEGRFIEPESFRAGLTGQSAGLTGWRGGARKGIVGAPASPDPEGSGQ